MSEEQEKQIVENNYVSMKKIKGQDEDWIYTIKHGAVTVQINKEKAEFICRMLADWLGFSVEKNTVISDDLFLNLATRFPDECVLKN